MHIDIIVSIALLCLILLLQVAQVIVQQLAYWHRPELWQLLQVISTSKITITASCPESFSLQSGEILAIYGKRTVDGNVREAFLCKLITENKPILLTFIDGQLLTYDIRFVSIKAKRLSEEEQTYAHDILQSVKAMVKQHEQWP